MKKVSILMYHQVGVFENITRFRANYCRVQDFAKQMAFLKTWRYPVIPMSQVLGFLKGEILPDASHAVAITFDDGYENFHQYAFPILNQYGFSAMVYVVSGQLNGNAQWLKEYQEDPPKLMSKQHLREVLSQGIELGAHTVTHPRLSKIDSTLALQELSDSKKQLEDVFGCAFDHLCYPYGDHDATTVSLAREAGYKVATTIVKGAATVQHDPLALPRKAVSFGRGRYRLWRDLMFKDGRLNQSIVQQSIA